MQSPDHFDSSATLLEPKAVAAPKNVYLGKAFLNYLEKKRLCTARTFARAQELIDLITAINYFTQPFTFHNK